MDPEEYLDLAACPVHCVKHSMGLRILRVHGGLPQVCRQPFLALPASLLCVDADIGVVGLDFPKKHPVFLRFHEGPELPIPKAYHLVEHGAIGEKGLHLPYLRRPKLGGAVYGGRALIRSY